LESTSSITRTASAVLQQPPEAGSRASASEPPSTHRCEAAIFLQPVAVVTPENGVAKEARQPDGEAQEVLDRQEQPVLPAETRAHGMAHRIGLQITKRERCGQRGPGYGSDGYQQEGQGQGS